MAPWKHRGVLGAIEAWMSDCLVIGGGVIGLAIAYELAGDGRSVRLIDAGQPGHEASWAGAGILPPASAVSPDPLEQLTALSNRLHREWSETLRETTAIDNGYRRSGAFYVARDAEEAANIAALHELACATRWEMRPITRGEMHELDASLDPAGELAAAYLVPDECQIRNPRHLKALMAGCLARGVEVVAGASADEFEIRGGRVRRVLTTVGSFEADRICVASGAWTGPLAARLGVATTIRPIRGQMVLLAGQRRILGRIVNEGRRYLVPRDDGRVLVGSTEEDVGFDRTTTAGVTSDLLAFALSLVPELAAARLERTWAGLRPATADRKPYLGRVPGVENVYLAAGHFRGGLQLSTGTAVVISQLMRDERPTVDLTDFAPDRASRDTSTRETGGRAAFAPHERH
jgi:glycine oxidase